jgi:hypothetical protein
MSDPETPESPPESPEAEPPADPEDDPASRVGRDDGDRNGA